jgi:hypothetical protein
MICIGELRCYNCDTHTSEVIYVVNNDGLLNFVTMLTVVTFTVVLIFYGKMVLRPWRKICVQ